ncbi:MAG: metal ABC transporter ATP-binding protein [Bacillota bacterium]
MNSLIELKNISVGYNNTNVLKNVNLNIKDNKFITLIGPNGGGKTTLMKTILGFLTPNSGTIRKKENLNIGYVPQKDSFEKSFPIKVKNVVLSGILSDKLFFHKYSKKNKNKLRDILNLLEINDLKNKQINELSGGEMQKVFLARALIQEPNLLLLDEPFANIDSESKNKYLKLLKDLSENMSILLISHDISVISSYTDDVICINKDVHYHDSNTLTNKELQNTYGCPVELVGHGIPHRVFPVHNKKEETNA